MNIPFVTGPGILTPYEGLIVNGECVANTELVYEQVSLELDVSSPRI